MTLKRLLTTIPLNKISLVMPQNDRQSSYKKTNDPKISMHKHFKTCRLFNKFRTLRVKKKKQAYARWSLWLFLQTVEQYSSLWVVLLSDIRTSLYRKKVSQEVGRSASKTEPCKVFQVFEKPMAYPSSESEFGLFLSMIIQLLKFGIANL